MRFLSAVLLFPLLSAQDQPSAEARPTPQQKARQLLDSSLETLSSATPAIQVAALLEIVQLYPDFDKKKTTELLDQAFAAAAAVPPESSSNVSPSNLQIRVVLAAAAVDPDKAIEMLAGLPVDRRGPAIDRIARSLLDRRDIDRAVRLTDENAGQGYPPLRAIDALLTALPADDPRRLSLFSNAFVTIQLDSGTPYQSLIAKHWRTLPRPVVEPAVSKLLDAILSLEDSSNTIVTLSGPRGSASFDTNKDYQLFDIIQVLREYDPKRAATLLEARPALQETVNRFPEGRQALTAGDPENLSINMRTTGKGESHNPNDAARMRLDALASTRSSEIVALGRKDLQTAISRVPEIPVEHMQVSTLIQLANLAASSDPATARAVVGQAVKILKTIKDPQLNAGAWAALADAAIAAKDNDSALLAINTGLASCAELYKLDTNADQPNQAERERWPSIQYLRSVLYRAAKAEGVDADEHLLTITDPDLVLMGRIEIARSLLGKPRGGTSISVSRAKRR